MFTLWFQHRKLSRFIITSIDNYFDKSCNFVWCQIRKSWIIGTNWKKYIFRTNILICDLNSPLTIIASIQLTKGMLWIIWISFRIDVIDSLSSAARIIASFCPTSRVKALRSSTRSWWLHSQAHCKFRFTSLAFALLNDFDYARI